MAFICCQCSTEYDTKVAWCWHCMSSGSVIIKPRRPKSKLSGQLMASNARKLSASHWDLQHSDNYSELRLLAGAMGLLVGPPGSGKSTMAALFLAGFKCPVALYSAEEGCGPTISERLARLNIRREDFHIFSGGNLDALVEEFQRLKIGVFCIDSLNVSSLLPAELRKMGLAAGAKVVLATQQVTKQGLPAGSNEWSHEADFVCWVDGMAWELTKSRYQQIGTKGAVYNGKS